MWYRAHATVAVVIVITVVSTATARVANVAVHPHRPRAPPAPPPAAHSLPAPLLLPVAAVAVVATALHLALQPHAIVGLVSALFRLLPSLFYIDSAVVAGVLSQRFLCALVRGLLMGRVDLFPDRFMTMAITIRLPTRSVVCALVKSFDLYSCGAASFSLTDSLSGRNELVLRVFYTGLAR